VFHKARQSAYHRAGNDAKSEAHRARAWAYAHFGALAGARCKLCGKEEPDVTLVEKPAVTLVEIRSWGPPAKYLCLTCAMEEGALKAASSENIKPSSNVPRAKQQGDTLNLKRSDKHKREPERESAADAAIAEAHEATARRHARELRAADNLAKFTSLQKTPDRPTLAQRDAPKTNVVVGPFVPFARPIPPLKPAS
jgi:hypothetical protein